ncbi:MAG: DinB family protein [Chloroflexi bacterium]|nr:DinB family protein [Chloroflexota bacterium]
MTQAEYLHQGMKFLHAALRDARNVNEEHLHFTPDRQAHSVAWVLWHAARIEDSIIQRVAQEKDLVWKQSDWAARSGLPARGIGTGQSPEEAQQLRITNREAFGEYAEAVAAATEAYLRDATDAELAREVQVGDRTETVGGAILLHLITHLNGHRGEINAIRGMQGLPPVVPSLGG